MLIPYLMVSWLNFATRHLTGLCGLMGELIRTETYYKTGEQLEYTTQQYIFPLLTFWPVDPTVVLSLTPKANGKTLSNILPSHVGLCVYINTYGVTSWGRARVECTPLQSRHGACHDSAPQFLQAQSLPGVQVSLGHTREGGPLAQVLDVLSWAVSSPRLPSPGNGNSVDWWPQFPWLQHLWSISWVFDFCSAPGSCWLHSGTTECDSISWLAYKCSGNFPNLVCSNEFAFTLCCMLISRDPSDTGKGSSTSGK